MHELPKPRDHKAIWKENTNKVKHYLNTNALKLNLTINVTVISNIQLLMLLVSWIVSNTLREANWVSYLEHIFIFSHFWVSCDQTSQNSKLPSRVWGLLQHFCPDMQGFVCLIWLIQPQALLYLVLGLVLAHLWYKAPHKNIHSFRPCNFSEAARK